MNCSECQDDYTDYLDGKVHGQQRHDVDTHLSACPGCTAILKRVRAIRLHLKRLPNRSLPSAFHFSMRKALAHQASSKGRYWKSLINLIPLPPATAGALAGMVLAFTVSYTIWGAGPSPLPDQILALPAQHTETEARIKYVLDHIPSRGTPISGYQVSPDSMKNGHSRSQFRSRTVSARF